MRAELSCILMSFVGSADTFLAGLEMTAVEEENKSYIKLTAHFDVLGDLDELHLSGHVPHVPHALPQVLVTDVAILISVKLLEGLQQFCQERPKVTLQK